MFGTNDAASSFQCILKKKELAWRKQNFLLLFNTIIIKFYYYIYKTRLCVYQRQWSQNFWLTWLVFVIALSTGLQFSLPTATNVVALCSFLSDE